jgi:O-methyltransferase
VARGGSSGALIAKRAQISNIDGRIFLCDTFAGVVKASKNDNAYTGGEHADTSEEAVIELLATMNLNNTLILRGVFPDDTGSEISSHNFRFAHIDVDVYQSAKEITDWAWPHLSNGGVIIYDEYGTESTMGVTRPVDEQQGLADRLTISTINRYALVIKLR